MIKLVYRREFFDVFAMKPGGRLVITINNDGTIIFREYKPGSRKVQSMYKGKCSTEEYATLCSNIKECINNADRLDSYCDDASEELKIYHQFGRVQIVDRGLGNADVQIGEIIHKFLDGVILND